MRAYWLSLTMAMLSLLLGGLPTANAQTPADYNHARATAHFLGSRYSYRTFYSSRPGSGSVAYNPFAYQSQFVEPGFTRQRITPYGYERFEAIPGLGGTTATPFGFDSYYVPGFGYGYFAPIGGPVMEYYYP
jgi:hypothetical protein